jgi:hypothetical protein
MREMIVNDEMTTDRGEWKEKTCLCRTQMNWGNGRKKKDKQDIFDFKIHSINHSFNEYVNRIY